MVSVLLGMPSSGEGPTGSRSRRDAGVIGQRQECVGRPAAAAVLVLLAAAAELAALRVELGIGKPAWAFTRSGTWSWSCRRTARSTRYFGTFPGADGYIDRSGRLRARSAQAAAACGRSTTRDDVDGGGPHGARSAARGHRRRQDGRLRRIAGSTRRTRRIDPDQPELRRDVSVRSDVMGYHDGTGRSPNYWAYAHNFVLAGHTCSSPARRGACPSAPVPRSRRGRRCCREPRHDADDRASKPVRAPGPRSATGYRRPGHYAWTDLTYLLHRQGVGWALLRGAGARSPTATTTR